MNHEKIIKTSKHTSTSDSFSSVTCLTRTGERSFIDFAISISVTVVGILTTFIDIGKNCIQIKTLLDTSSNTNTIYDADKRNNMHLTFWYSLCWYGMSCKMNDLNSIQTFLVLSWQKTMIQYDTDEDHHEIIYITFALVHVDMEC